MPLFKALSSVKDKLTLTPNELLLKEATSNDDISVPNTTLHNIAELTFHPSEYTKVMEAIWSSIRAPRQEWRRIQRGLILADILMKFGSARTLQELRDYYERFKPLQDFKYSDEEGDRGAIIREKSRYLVDILPDFNKIEQERELAKKHKNKCIGMSRDEVYRGNYRKNQSYDDVRGKELRPDYKSANKDNVIKRNQTPPDDRQQIEIKEERKIGYPPKPEKSMNPSYSQPQMPSYESRPVFEVPKVQQRPETNSGPGYSQGYFQPPPSFPQPPATLLQSAPAFPPAQLSQPTPSYPQNVPNNYTNPVPYQQGFTYTQNPPDFPQNPTPYTQPPSFTSQPVYPQNPVSYPSNPINYSHPIPPVNSSTYMQNPPVYNQNPVSQNPTHVINPQYSQTNPGHTNNPNYPQGTGNTQFQNPNLHYSNTPQNPVGFQQPMNYYKGNASTVKCNLADQRVVEQKPNTGVVDLESMLMNLDGLESSLSNKRK
ncbi:hypothetical protein SteCoe_32512 [Stentor coeruleus]|uniref:ENTH domain-containing protein n=1 Tax=Stentor coeruleus TaxID=5963 RepID=A0A1R2AYX6_9CILI|nr:hypothetical protein SteCoe_32512 [Stentor coeruleus]